MARSWRSANKTNSTSQPEKKTKQKCIICTLHRSSCLSPPQFWLFLSTYPGQVVKLIMYVTRIKRADKVKIYISLLLPEGTAAPMCWRHIQNGCLLLEEGQRHREVRQNAFAAEQTEPSV